MEVTGITTVVTGAICTARIARVTRKVHTIITAIMEIRTVSHVISMKVDITTKFNIGRATFT